MLLANEAVATRLMSENQKAIYRVHEEPDARRINEFREDVLSHHIPCGNLTKRPEVSKLLQKLDTMPIGAALKIGFLRSLMRARYDVEPLGHYGLAKAKYTHFTSPIRRYADLVVHRALFQASHGPTHSLKETAEHISDTERNSADAERDSKDVKMYAFLKAQLAMPKPPVYPALVIDVRNFGFFVDVPGLAMSGLIHCSSLTDDFYEFDEARGHARRAGAIAACSAWATKWKCRSPRWTASRSRWTSASPAKNAKDRDRPPVAAGESRSNRPHFQKSRDWRSAADGDRPRSKRPPQGPPQRKFGKFKTQSQSRPTLPNRPSRDAKSRPARPQSGGGNFRAGPSRPQIPSSHSRSKFGGRRRR
jgi:ribonuclease R